ncbi:MAG: DinB family protein [Chitinophagales bacterium]
MNVWKKPATHEYATYYEKYIERVPEGNLIQILKNQIKETVSFLKSIPEEKLNHSYAAGKWTIKQILQHMIDAERIFSYRLLRIARNDKTPLPGFDEEEYAREAFVDERKFEIMIAEFEIVRSSTLLLLETLNENEMNRIGTASNQPASARSISYIIAGHELHHISIMKERYL